MNDNKGFESGAAAGPRSVLFRTALLAACALFLAGSLAGCGRHHRAAKTQEEFQARFEKVTNRALKKADATDEQKAAIKPIANDLAASMWAFREEHRAIRERFVKAFEADKVDAGEVAKIRSDALALADRASAKMTEALVKASGILSPGQRRKLTERWRKCM
jgi:Spy/CpxP family protein refolding chaperone